MPNKDIEELKKIEEESESSDLELLKYDVISEAKKLMKEVRKQKYRSMNLASKTRVLRPMFKQLADEHFAIYRGIIIGDVRENQLPILELLVKQREAIARKEIDLQETTNTVAKFFYSQYKK